MINPGFLPFQGFCPIVETMTEPNSFLPVKLIVGMISSSKEILEATELRLIERHGAIDLRSGDYPFDLTDYYEPQMGKGLTRRFVCFEKLIAPGDLPGIKIETNALEVDIRIQSKQEFRIVNIDPGYITQASLVMATAKNFAHRIPLAQGIYAHLELLFSKNGVKLLDWTYPDFRVPACQGFLVDVRRRYLEQIR
jgi:hypothetical protein